LPLLKEQHEQIWRELQDEEETVRDIENSDLLVLEELKATIAEQG
jgi:hypothetical protein